MTKDQSGDKSGEELIRELRATLDSSERTGYGAMHGGLMGRVLTFLESHVPLGTISECPSCGGDGKLTTTPGQHGPCWRCGGSGRVMAYRETKEQFDARMQKVRGFVDSCSTPSHVVPSVPLEGAPREVWIAKGRISGQWEHHAFREPTVEGWQRYVREDLVAPSATVPSEIIELLKDVRHAGELGYHGGEKTHPDCPDCKIVNRLIKATDGSNDPTKGT